MQKGYVLNCNSGCTQMRFRVYLNAIWGVPKCRKIYGICVSSVIKYKKIMFAETRNS